MLNPSKKYNLEYYLGVVDKIVAMGAHILGVKACKRKSDIRVGTLS
jgi:pyruvate carboxylase